MSHPLLTKTITRTPCYFGSSDRPLFGWCHAPQEPTKTELGIVICPPIGHEHIHSYRALRHLADGFSAQDITALRIDYHGIGNSSGTDEDPDRLTAWLDSITAAIKALKTNHGCTSVGLVGLRMGATLAATIAERMKLACLVVWAPCESGRRYMREVKLLSPSIGEGAPIIAGAKNEIESAGFVITEQTASQLSELNLHKTIPNNMPILIAARDDLNDDLRLKQAWQDKELSVEYLRLPGFIDMVASPHHTQVPHKAITEIVGWVKKHASQQAYIANQKITVSNLPASHHVKAKVSDNVTEMPICFGKQRELFGIFCEPSVKVADSRPTILFLNAGAVHHIGANRLYVFLVRELAKSGFCSLRMDFNGLGDSIALDGEIENELYKSTTSNNVGLAIEELQQCFESRKFILAGLCGGAYASFHAKLDLPNMPIVECILINPLTFYWQEGMSLDASPVAHYRNWDSYMKSLRQWDRWIKLLSGNVSIKNIFTTAFKRSIIFMGSKIRTAKNISNIHKPPTLIEKPKGDLSTDIKRLVSDNTQLSFIFSDTDPGRGILMSEAKSTVKKLIQKESISISLIENADHTFKPRKARQQLISHLKEHIIQRYH